VIDDIDDEDDGNVVLLFFRPSIYMVFSIQGFTVEIRLLSPLSFPFIQVSTSQTGTGLVE